MPCAPPFQPLKGAHKPDASAEATPAFPLGNIYGIPSQGSDSARFRCSLIFLPRGAGEVASAERATEGRVIPAPDAPSGA
jgi:hypothetical protein